jgi:hypothetical protein
LVSWTSCLRLKFTLFISNILSFLIFPFSALHFLYILLSHLTHYDVVYSFSFNSVLF